MNVMTPTPTPGQSTAHADLPAHAITDRESEPTFTDLPTLMRHKRVIIACTLVGAIGGVALAMQTPRTYSFTTTMELGSTQVGSSNPIEPAEAVIAKVTNAFLPSIERAYGETIGDPGFSIGLDIKNPKGTNLLLMKSKGPLDKQDEHRELHHQVVERVLAEHHQDFQMVRTNLDLELEQARRDAAALKDQAASLLLRRTWLQESRNLTNDRLVKIDSELARLATNREIAGKTVSAQDQVLTLMMLDMDRNREQDKRDNLQRQLSLGLAEEADRLTRDEADLKRTEQEQAGRITAIQARIANVAETKLVGEIQRSQKPVGMGKTLIAGLGVILGMTVGMMSAFLQFTLHQQRESKVGDRIA